MNDSEAIAEIMQDLETLRYLLDGAAEIGTQAASDRIYRIMRRLEDATGVVFYPRGAKTPAEPRTEVIHG